MPNLDTKTKYVNLVIRKKSYPDNFDNLLLGFVRTECNKYTYICHEHDINEYGELEDKHYHLVLEYKDVKRLSTHLLFLVDCLNLRDTVGIQIDKIVSKTRSIQYLTHCTHPEKTQHSIDEVISNIPRDELELYFDKDNEDDTITFDYLYKVINEKPSKLYVMKRIGIVAYKNYRNVICDMLEEYKLEKSGLQ